MLEFGNEHAFYVRSDGMFYAHTGMEIVLKAEKRGDTYAYPFDARYSTPDKDREEEIAVQKGLNFDPFKEYGEFNWNHIPHAMVGLPVGDKAVYDDAGWRGKGEIIKSMPIWPGYDTDMVVVQHNQFKKAGYKRGLCCSIEGKILKRSSDGRRIEKADVYNVALTFRPINPNCTVNMLAKAMRGETPIIQGDELFRSLSVSGIGSFKPQDLEGGGDAYDPKKLIQHLVKKGHTRSDAERHVYKYLYGHRQQRRA